MVDNIADELLRNNAIGILFGQLQHAETTDANFPKLSSGARHELSEYVVTRNGYGDPDKNFSDAENEVRTNRKFWQSSWFTRMFVRLKKKLVG